MSDLKSNCEDWVFNERHEHEISNILNRSKTMICKLLCKKELERQQKRTGRKKKLSKRYNRRIVKLSR